MLTDTRLRALKPSSAPFKVSDAGGLHVLVTPAGGKLWKLSYRFGGKQKTLSLGAYPDVSLAEARGKREAAKSQIRAGADPGAIAQAEKVAERRAELVATAGAFKAVAADWKLRKMVKEGKSAATLRRTDWLLKVLNAGIGDRPIGEITAPELLKVLRQADAAGRHEKVGRLRSTAGQIFRFGIATGMCERDVAADLRGATTVVSSTPHAAVTDPAEIGRLMRAIDTLDGSRHARLMRLALQMLAYTFVRPGELRLAEWSEINTGIAVWDIPAERAKMRVAHRVPLSRQVIKILDEVREINGERQYIFASTVKPKLALEMGAFNDALRRIGYSHDDHVAHGFRAMASTTLNEMVNEKGERLWSVDAIERQLAHQERNKVRKVYNRATYWPERVKMTQAWADHLDELRDRGRIVTLPKRRRK